MTAGKHSLSIDDANNLISRAFPNIPEQIVPKTPIIAALGNQYVTFQPEMKEVFRIAGRPWPSDGEFSVMDGGSNPWMTLRELQVRPDLFP